MLHARISILSFGAVSIGNQEVEQGTGEEPSPSVSLLLFSISFARAWSLSLSVRQNKTVSALERKVRLVVGHLGSTLHPRIIDRMIVHIFNRNRVTRRSLPSLAFFYLLSGEYPPACNSFSVMRFHTQPIIKPNKSRQINRRDVRCSGGFRRCGVLWFIHDFWCRSPAVSALLRSANQ